MKTPYLPSGYVELPHAVEIAADAWSDGEFSVAAAETAEKLFASAWSRLGHALWNGDLDGYITLPNGLTGIVAEQYWSCVLPGRGTESAAFVSPDGSTGGIARLLRADLDAFLGLDRPSHDLQSPDGGEVPQGGVNWFAGGVTYIDADYDEKTGEAARTQRRMAPAWVHTEAYDANAQSEFNSTAKKSRGSPKLEEAMAALSNMFPDGVPEPLAYGEVRSRLAKGGVDIGHGTLRRAVSALKTK